MVHPIKDSIREETNAAGLNIEDLEFSQVADTRRQTGQPSIGHVKFLPKTKKAFFREMTKKHEKEQLLPQKSDNNTVYFRAFRV